jgi:tyrosine-specific transport protein
MTAAKTAGAIMLVSCTAIGGGILALPVQTFNAGIIPTSINFVISWLFMSLSALYLFEVSISAKPQTNIISMANENLGATGKAFAWITYLALLYALMCAFISSISAWLSHYLEISTSVASIAISLLFSSIIYAGNTYLDSINKIFSLALFCCLFYIIAIAAMQVDLAMFEHNNLARSILNTPLIITAFGFAIIIPSINNYLKFETKKILKVIVIGATIPLIIYLLWEFALLGALNQQLSVIDLKHTNGTEVASALSATLNTSSITLIANIFSITSIVTSILGVSLSLFDFLADGFKIHKNPNGKILLCGIIFIPTILLNQFSPMGFNTILSFGGIFVAALLGILPSLMVWQKRKQSLPILGQASVYLAPGGFSLIAINILFFTSIIGIEIYNLT